MENAVGPTILKSSTPSPAAAKGPQSWFRRNLIIIVIAIVILGVLAFGAFSMFSSSGGRGLNILQPQVNELSNAQISLIPEKEVYKTGETVSVNVKLYTGGYSTGSTDLVVKYDPKFLKPQGNTFASVGQIYSEYPAAQVEEQKGLIGMSGITNSDTESFSGIGNFAKLNFTALQDGQTTVSVDFQPNITSDSNVLIKGTTKDILGVVENAQINISSSGASPAKAATAENCGSFTQYCEDANKQVGTQVCNLGTIKNNSCGYDSRVTTSCEVCKIQ